MRCKDENHEPKQKAVLVSFVPRDRVGEGRWWLRNRRKNVKYAGPVKMEANISPAAGYAQIQQFGQFISYDKVIITDDMTCPIDENAVLFIDKKPEYKDGRPLYDYVVKQIAKSLNLVSIAVSKVNVS